MILPNETRMTYTYEEETKFVERVASVNMDPRVWICVIGLIARGVEFN